ncbi:MAG TPA: hypothetical protein VH913_13165 [Hyphomicrobiaceae bacterium]
MTNTDRAKSRALRPGDVVEVRSTAEILATLDGDAALANMPFMPEMLRYTGSRFRVSRRVDKICDTIAYTGSRRLRNTVYLEDLRCDGSSHGGCQAGCKLYWNEAWLRRVDDDHEGPADRRDDGNGEELASLANKGARTVRSLEGAPTEVWRCQATEALKASTHLRGFDIRQYWREMTNGNFGLYEFCRIMATGIVIEIAVRLGFSRRLPLRGPGKGPRVSLGLKPGDVVTVRSPGEIAATLDGSGLDRGLSFDREMLPFCGQTVRVKDRVVNIVDDKTGRLLNIRKDCLILEGAVCSGTKSFGCLYCPREIHAYWREAWVQSVEKNGERSVIASEQSA